MKYLYHIAFLLFLVSCNNETYQDIPEETNDLLQLDIPSNMPEVVYPLESNRPTEKGFELGKKLFFDGRLASDGVVSCGFCHIQEFSFTHHTHIVSHGVDGAIGTRNAQPLQNLIFFNEFTWDGAAQHLDMQPIIPITSAVEMNETFTSVLAKLEADEEYVQLFSQAFENGQIDTENMLKALSQFMIMMVSANSKYDKFTRGEGNVTLNPNEAEGLALFNQKCATCHAGALFTDQSYRNNGLAIDPTYNDIGRARVTGLTEDNRKFRVPSLKNIDATFPYMHDGRLATLTDVLDFYSGQGMVDSPTLDPIFKQPDGSIGIPLTEDEKTKIISFLRTLTDDEFLDDNRFKEFTHTVSRIP
ncbi:cytochrome-c peroxidase [Sungkyunkwania multivorans]|uniref:Cytochrome-c peroxidase n=1 Tax=Sungkyunkwania multivorans TaxID=1173618 RepID=A0ABW3D274_9FLAO